MAGETALRVEGLGKLVRELESLGVAVEDLKDTMGEISAAAVEVIEPNIPVRSGALRSTIRGTRSKGRAAAIAGRARVPYAPVVNYGRDGKSGARFMQAADTPENVQRWAQMLDAGIQRAIERAGLQP